VSESGGLESDLGTTDPTSHQRQPKYFQKEFLKALTALGKEKIEIPVDGKAIEAWTKLACDPEKLNKVFPKARITITRNSIQLIISKNTLRAMLVLPNSVL
jgi:hypothetical protein